MNIIKKVLIKQIVTEESKAKISSNFHNHKLRLEQECQQLLFEKRKLQNKTGVSKQDIEQRFQQEINNRKEKIKLIDFKIDQLNELEIGSEIIESEVDALVEVEIGANWKDLMEEQAIIIKDDVVVRIEK